MIVGMDPIGEHPPSWWQRFHNRPWWQRGPLKAAFFLAVVILALYPKVWLIPVQISRLCDLNSVLDPQNPGLAVLEQEVRAALPANAQPRVALKAVEDVVYEHIPYAWDWDTWGVMDFLPTTAEALALGREDCDGRAVVAASLLCRMGYKAWLVTDILHMWVATEAGETMSPGLGAKSLAITPTGTKPSFDWKIVENLGRGAAYGVAVFPLIRELIILAALAFVLTHPWSAGWRRALGWVLLAAGFAALRLADPKQIAWEATPTLCWIGLSVAFVGCITLVAHQRRAAPPVRTTAL